LKAEDGAGPDLIRVRFRPNADISLRDKDVVTSKYHLIVLKHPVTERHSSAPA
jgi:hypothetical protein